MPTLRVHFLQLPTSTTLRVLIDNESSITNESNARMLADSQLQTEINGLNVRVGIVEEELEAVIQLAPSSAVVTDAFGDVVSSVTSDTEIAYLAGLSSNVQDQLDDKLSLSTGGILTGASTLAITGLNTNQVLVTDASKTLVSSGVSNTTLGYLDGVTSSVQTQLDDKLPLTGGTITGNLALDNLSANRVLISNGSKTLTSSSVSNTTLGYLDATSSIQTQLNSKLGSSGGTITGNLTMNNLTADRVLVTDGSKNVANSSVSSTTLGYLNGVSSSIQTQLNGKLNTSGGTLTGNLTLNNLGGNKVLILDGNRNVTTAMMSSSALDSWNNGVMVSDYRHYTSTGTTTGWSVKIITGVISTRTTTGSETISFPSGFSYSSATSYSVQATIRRTSNTTVQETVYILNKTTTGLSYRTLDPAGGTQSTFDFLCIGI